MPSALAGKRIEDSKTRIDVSEWVSKQQETFICNDVSDSHLWNTIVASWTVFHSISFRFAFASRFPKENERQRLGRERERVNERKKEREWIKTCIYIYGFHYDVFHVIDKAISIHIIFTLHIFPNSIRHTLLSLGQIKWHNFPGLFNSEPSRILTTN